jgi:hypothetical protein
MTDSAGDRLEGSVAVSIVVRSGSGMKRILREIARLRRKCAKMCRGCRIMAAVVSLKRKRRSGDRFSA